MGINLGNAALRLATGAFILNSGIGKLHLEPEHAAGLHTAATRAVPQLGHLEPEQFGKYLSFAEIGIGSALLAPFVPTRLAGLMLGTFATGLLATYLKSPGMTEADGVRPTAAGTGMAKDIWLAGIAAALIFQRKRR
jgi:hypothetical protein